MLKLPPDRFVEIKEGRPFHDLIAAFFAATLGLGDVFDPNNRRRFSPNVLSLYQGRIQPMFSIDQQQIHNTALRLDVQRAIALLCGMLANAAYEAVKLPKMPVTEVLRHVRNAASHGNRFHFSDCEPARPAKWRSFVIDERHKGDRNRLNKITCFPDTLGPADLVMLLCDVDQLLP